MAAEFSVVIKKKDTDNHLVFYGDDSDSSYSYSRPRKQTTKKKTKKHISPRKNEYKHVSPRKNEATSDDLPICPVCHEELDGRTKRVYSKPISTEVYFPFLNQDDIDPSSGRVAKVKICFPCYENLMIQWKEYNKAGVPQNKRKYRNLQGKRIKTGRDKRREEMKKMAAEAAEAEEPSPVMSKEIVESKESGLTKQDEMNDLMAQIHAHIELVEFNSNANLDRTRMEIEHAIRKHSNRMKDDIQGLKVENEVVRKQVVRMRRELAEMRMEVSKDVRTVKKKVLKNERQLRKDHDNETNIKKSEDGWRV